MPKRTRSAQWLPATGERALGSRSPFTTPSPVARGVKASTRGLRRSAWVLAPGEVLAIRRSPYTTPSAISHWREVLRIKEKVCDVSKPDAERRAVERWVEQLVRKALGDFLDDVEEAATLRFAVKLDAGMANLVSQALNLRAAASCPDPSKQRARK